jgi:hypothetical protein
MDGEGDGEGDREADAAAGARAAAPSSVPSAAPASAACTSTSDSSPLARRRDVRVAAAFFGALASARFALADDADEEAFFRVAIREPQPAAAGIRGAVDPSAMKGRSVRGTRDVATSAAPPRRRNRRRSAPKSAR